MEQITKTFEAAIVSGKETSESEVHKLDDKNYDIIKRNRPNIYQNQIQFRGPRLNIVKKTGHQTTYNRMPATPNIYTSKQEIVAIAAPNME